jgi:hypothetical protein
VILLVAAQVRVRRNGEECGDVPRVNTVAWRDGALKAKLLNLQWKKVVIEKEKVARFELVFDQRACSSYSCTFVVKED